MFKGIFSPQHREMTIYIILMLLIGAVSAFVIKLWAFAVVIAFTIIYWFGLSLWGMLRGDESE